MPIVKVHGFDNSVLHIDFTGSQPDRRTPIQKVDFIEVAVATLGEALAAYCEQAAVTIIPYDGRFDSPPSGEGQAKYFLYDDGGQRFGKMVTDIHVRRGKENICPKQNLSFSLIDGDYVHFGFYGC